MAAEPYYSEDGIELYLGDCEDVLPQLGLFDLQVTSAPYNLGTTSGGGFADTRKYPGMKMGKWSGGGLAQGYDDHDDALSPEEYVAWQQRVLKLCWDHLTDAGALFYNHKPRVQDGVLWLPLELNPGLPLRQIITWVRPGGVNFAPTHLCPTYEWILLFARPAWRLKSKAASGIGDVWKMTPEPSEHPAPFPLGLPARAIEATDPSRVLDPFCGSGTTLRAAKDAGVAAVGIEKSERYCEMAVRRLAQQTFPFT